jgi:hypothetical protein
MLILRHQHHGARENSLINRFAKRIFNWTKIHNLTAVRAPPHRKIGATPRYHH